MGNGVSRAMAGCFVPLPVHNTREHSNALFSQPSDEGLGHSFCYIRPSAESPLHIAHSDLVSAEISEHGSSPDCVPVPGYGHGHSHSHSHIDFLKSHSETTFKAISGASVSANTSTPCTVVCYEQIQTFTTISDDKAAAFECTPSFASLPLQPIPKGNSSIFSGPISLPLDKALFSGPLDRGLPSGPLERGFLSGPLERSCMSGPIDMSFDPSHFSAPLPGSYVNYIGNKRRVAGLIDGMRKPMKRVLNGATSRMKSMHSHVERGAKALRDPPSVCFLPPQDDESHNLQWAHGKAGEDRVHVVLSDKHGWLFVGIYDGFNGPDAPDFLMGNLYATIYKEMQGLLWDTEEGLGSTKEKPLASRDKTEESRGAKVPQHLTDRNQGEAFDSCFSNGHCENVDRQNKRIAQAEQGSCSPKIRSLGPKKGSKPCRGMSFPSSHHLRDKENYMRFSDGYSSLHRDMNNNGVKSCRPGGADHSAVLRALARALEATEKAFLDMADHALNENPELALMGSCLLVMLMKDEDVYVMNVGDSRAIIGQHRKYGGHHKHQFSQEDLHSYDIYVDCKEKIGARDTMMRVDLERIIEENPSTDLEAFEAPGANNTSPTANLLLSALQLSKDHCTSVEGEVRRIKAEHPDDKLSIVNDRVKGTLKVTRAFGAGFLKKPQWNSAILEMFQIDYVGSAPYITCSPSLCHHRLSQNDRFLILSSDGLYQYLSNQEVVSHVEWFMEMFPEGDPAQHLVEELLFRAAKKAGMDFHQLLDVPQGDRRKYHDDVSVMVISLQGRIWRSCS